MLCYFLLLFCMVCNDCVFVVYCKCVVVEFLLFVMGVPVRVLFEIVWLWALFGGLG